MSKKSRRELAKLVREQSNDDATNHLPDTYSVGNRTVTRLTNDSYLPECNKKDGFIYLEGIGSWDGAAHRAYEAGEAPCPVCGGRKLRTIEICLCCCRCGLDGKVRYPGLPIGGE